MWMHYGIFKCEDYACIWQVPMLYRKHKWWPVILLLIPTTLIFLFYLHIGQVHMLVINISVHLHSCELKTQVHLYTQSVRLHASLQIPMRHLCIPTYCNIPTDKWEWLYICLLKIIMISGLGTWNNVGCSSSTLRHIHITDNLFTSHVTQSS